MTDQTGAATTTESLSALAALRRRLTIWYVGTFALILFALGSLLFMLIARQTTRELRNSLRSATIQVAHATEIREREAQSGGNTADAVEELHIPDRSLFLFDTAGRVLSPHIVARELTTGLRELVRQAKFSGAMEKEFANGPDQTLVAYVEPFVLPNGHRYVALAVADRIELEARYATLIATFTGLAVIGLVLVAVGGLVLAQQAMQPVERNLEFMRRFMAEAAHELRTPITILRSRIDVTLQRDRTPDAYVAALMQMDREATQLGGIVDDLLTLARADTGGRPLQKIRMALDEVVLDCVTSAAALASSHGVTLQVERADDAPVYADPALMRQLVMILLDNAIKYTPSSGSVTVDVYSDQGQAVVQVADTGRGIVADELPRVYDRFYRGESARSSAGGAGLGLSIARWIVDAHSAQLHIRSAPGTGTVVLIDIQLAQPASGS